MKFYAPVFALILIFSSCKYEDGPFLSLRSKTERLVKEWKLDQFFENGVEKTDEAKSQFSNYTLTIYNNNTYTLTYSLNGVLPYSESGTWKFANKKKDLILTDDGDETKYEILKLKETQLWVIGNWDNNEYEIRLK